MKALRWNQDGDNEARGHWDEARGGREGIPEEDVVKRLEQDDDMTLEETTKMRPIQRSDEFRGKDRNLTNACKRELLVRKEQVSLRWGQEDDELRTEGDNAKTGGRRWGQDAAMRPRRSLGEDRIKIIKIKVNTEPAWQKQRKIVAPQSLVF